VKLRQLAVSLLLVVSLVSGCAAGPAAPRDTSVTIPAPAASPAGFQPTLTAPPTVTPQLPLSAATRQQIFDEVWTTVNTNYIDPQFNGADWAAVRTDYAVRVTAAADDAAFYDLMAAMVRELNDQHSRFLPPAAAAEEDLLTAGRDERVGIGVIVQPRESGLLIQHVFPDGPAAEAGLQPRDRIILIDGDSFRSRSLEGQPGSRVQLLIVRPGSESFSVQLTRRFVEGQILPLQRRLNGNIGYLAVSTLWVNDMHRRVETALNDLTAAGPLDGLVLDLRGNPGGWRDVLIGILGHFTVGEVGGFTSRTGTTPLKIPAAAPQLQGLPIAVLIDRSTASYAELLAAVLQAEADALVVGAISAGNTETIYAYQLTAGTRLWVAQEGFALRDGTNLEGRGVIPDCLQQQDWTLSAFDDDPDLLLALKLLTINRPGC
jgi:carboxyl-terminal processing protease